MFLSPWKSFQKHFIEKGLSTCIRAGNGSNWMTIDEYYNFVQCFISSIQRKNTAVLIRKSPITFDLQESRICKAKSTNIRLQPLDRSLYGHIKERDA